MDVGKSDPVNTCTEFCFSNQDFFFYVTSLKQTVEFVHATIKNIHIPIFVTKRIDVRVRAARGAAGPSAGARRGEQGARCS